MKCNAANKRRDNYNQKAKSIMADTFPWQQEVLNSVTEVMSSWF